MKRNLVFLLITNLLLIVCALYLLPFIRFSSKSLGLDFIVILVWSALVMGASWAEVNAILPKRSDLDPDVVKSRRLHLGRSLLLIVAILANYAWTDLTAGDFWFSYYAKYGVYTTAMRSNNREKTVWAMKRSSNIITPELVRGLLPQVVQLTRSQDPVVRGKAFAWLGYGIRQMNLLLASNVENSTKKQAINVKKVLITDLSGLFTCLRQETKPQALKGCVYAAGWMSKHELLGPISDVIARAKDPAVLVAATMACRNIGGLRALHILAGLVSGTTGLPRQSAVAGYLNAASVLVDVKSPVINSQGFADIEQRLAKQVPLLPKPALCVFLQHFSSLGDARFSKAIAQVIAQTDKPSVCPDIEIVPPIGIPLSLSLRRDFYESLANAVSCIAKDNDILLTAIKNRVAKGGNPRLVRLLKRISNAAGK